ncbi:MAG: hypothetical protein AB7V43_10935 [Acidimicrobiia bacterium]
MPDPITGATSATGGHTPRPLGPAGSLAVTPESLIRTADALRTIAGDLDAFGDVVSRWQRPVGTDEVMGPGNADRSWRQLAERWGAELRFYGDEAAQLADMLHEAAMDYDAVETEVSARCRG